MNKKFVYQAGNNKKVILWGTANQISRSLFLVGCTCFGRCFRPLSGALWGVTLTPHPLLVPWSWKGRAIPLLPPWAVRPVQSVSACTRVYFTFTSISDRVCLQANYVIFGKCLPWMCTGVCEVTGLRYTSKEECYGWCTCLDMPLIDAYVSFTPTKAAGSNCKSILYIQSLTFRRLMSYIHGAPILDVSRSHTTTQHSR